MTLSDPVVAQAASKMKRHDGRVYVGCLTPTEALALCSIGAHPCGNPQRVLDDLQEHKRKGISNPRWFYCTLTGRSVLAVERWSRRK